jgi:hypothetical protein
MTSTISPFGLQDIDDELETGFIEDLRAPSQLLQLLIDQLATEQTTLADDLEYVSR